MYLRSEGAKNTNLFRPSSCAIPEFGFGISVWDFLEYNPVQDDRSDFTQSRPLYGDIGPHVLRTPVLLGEALLARDVFLHTGLNPQMGEFII